MGRDCRLSSPELAEAVAKGINSTGINVVDIGMVSTPMLYFSLYNLDVDGGVMITASHNPGEYNGIKLILQGKIPFSVIIFRTSGKIAEKVASLHQDQVRQANLI